VRVPLAGAAALPAASTLGLRASATQNLAVNFVVDGGGRRGAGVAPSALFVEKQARRRPTPARP